MSKPWVQWTLAVIITLASAIYQRRTGPTYPARGTVELGGQSIALKLLRTHSITGRMPVTVNVADTAAVGVVEWRRYPTNDPWRTEPMARQGAELSTVLPPAPEALMPMAGKLEYRVKVSRGAEQAVVHGLAPALRACNDQLSSASTSAASGCGRLIRSASRASAGSAASAAPMARRSAG